MPPTPDAFAGFGPQSLDFFRDLDAHQSREWFQANRETYEREVRRPMEALIADLSAGFARRAIPLTGEPGRAQFRLNRDVRFARDKSPYKAHAGAALTRDGAKAEPGMLYIHVDPEGSFAAAGFYRPEARELAAIRGAIRDRPADFARILAGLGRAKLPLEPGDPLKRIPRGFEAMADSPLADALKRRSLLVARPLAEADLRDPALVATLDAFARAALPLLRFGWSALDAGDAAAPSHP